ncbi:MAG: four helix bundle protein [Ferruginibacter sp.]
MKELRNEGMKESVIKVKSYQFALRIIKLYKHLLEDKKEYTLSKQLLRSGTSIGASVEEASGCQSKKDFIARFHIALKEAKETHYWLRLLKDNEYAESLLLDSFLKDCEELTIIMTAILKSSKTP